MKYSVIVYFDCFDWSILFESKDIDKAQIFMTTHHDYFCNCELCLCEDKNGCLTVIDKYEMDK